LNVLVGEGLLGFSDEKYAIDGEFPTLNPTHPAAQTGYIRYAGEVETRWRQLEDATRGKVVAKENFEDITGRDPKTMRAFVGAMNANAGGQAAAIGKKFSFQGRRVLDVGAGAGTYSLQVGRAHPDSSGVLLELPGVAGVTEEYVRSAGLGQAWEVVAGDYHEELPSGQYDDVFLFAILHQEPEVEARSLLQRCRKHLSLEGRIFVSSFFLNEERTSPPFAAMFAVEMMVMVPGGRVYTHEEMRRLLGESGFERVKVHEDLPGPATLYVGYV
jgi:2-polyprenyl-3-methyl-5-hydroxy-6-metoxy-1,4-benzoquinol methylase